MLRPCLAVIVCAYRYRGLLPGRPQLVEDAGGPLDSVAGDVAHAASLFAHGSCQPDGLAPLPLAFTPQLSHLAGQGVVFPPGACLPTLLAGFLAPTAGLAAFDGLPAPGHLSLGPGQRFAGACLFSSSIRARIAARRRPISSRRLSLDAGLSSTLQACRGSRALICSGAPACLRRWAHILPRGTRQVCGIRAASPGSPGGCLDNR